MLILKANGNTVIVLMFQEAVLCEARHPSLSQKISLSFSLHHRLRQLSRCLVLLSAICLIGIILVVASSVAKPFEYQQDDVTPIPTFEPFVPVPYDPPVLSDACELLF